MRLALNYRSLDVSMHLQTLLGMVGLCFEIVYINRYQWHSHHIGLMNIAK